MMRLHWYNGSPVTQDELTPEQVEALARIKERWGLTDTVHITRGFGGEYVMVDVGCMVLGVETDGHVHS